MNIGITFDLRDAYLAAGYGEEETAEFDRADTIDAIDDALRALGHETDRIGHARALLARLAAGERWDLVFNICEGLGGPGRESQVPAILDLYGLPHTFADAAVMALCLDKRIAKLVVREAGVPTPDFALVTSRADVERAAALLGDRLPLFVKPVGEGTGKGISPRSIIETLDRLPGECARLLDAFRQPVLVETCLSGREFTVGVIGTGETARVLGTLEVHFLAGADGAIYSYANKENCEELVECRLVRPLDDPEVEQAEAIALAAWRALGCRDGGRVDVRSDASGVPHFLEANALAGLHPTHSDLPMLATALGLEYVELIRRIVDATVDRLARTQPRGCALDPA